MNTKKIITMIKINKIKTIKNEYNNKYNYKHNKKHNIIINKKIHKY